MKKNTQGKFILVEGISGSGKTTLIRDFLVPFLKERGIDVVSNTEPTRQNAFGRTIRALIEGRELDASELKNLRKGIAFLDVAFGLSTFVLKGEPTERMQEFLRILDRIATRLENGKSLSELERQLLFLADRCLDLHETILPALREGKWVVQDRYDLSSFAYGSAHGVPLKELYEWHRAVLGSDYLVPDITFFVSIPPEIAVRRLQASGKVIDIHENLESLKTIDAQYTYAISHRMTMTMEEHLKTVKKRVATTLIIQGRMRGRELAPKAVFNQMKKILNEWWFEKE